MDNKLCKYPWTVNFVDVNTDRWRFCCKVAFNSYEKNDEVLKSVKSAFLMNRQHPACSSCWHEEAKSGVSFRTSQKSAHTTIEELVKNPPLKIIDLVFGDVCNMYCVSCGPENSSTWQQLLKENTDIESKFNQAWEKLFKIIQENEDITHINLHGGEPSMDQNFSLVVDRLIDIGYKKLVRIITNGNYSDALKIKFENNINKLLDNGNRVDLVFSLDAAGQDGEWLRGGLRLAKFIPNILYMSTKDLNLQVNISISILNLENHTGVLHLLDSIKILDKVIININTVNQPHFFSIAILGNKIHDFLPKDWPKEMDSNWQNYYDKLMDVLSVQLKSTSEPSKPAIEKLIARMNFMVGVTKETMTPYYIDLVKRLEKLLVD